MANTLYNVDMITQESLMHFTNELVGYKLISHEWDDEFGKTGAKIGDTLRIRKTQNATVREGTKFSAQNIQDDYTTLTLDTQLGVDFTLGSKELALNIDRLGERYLKPYMRRLANEVDYRIFGLYKKVPNAVGTCNTAPTAVTTFLDAKAKLDRLGVPRDKRIFVLDPTTEVAVVGFLDLEWPGSSLVAKQYATGEMGKALGATWYSSANVNSHTAGALGGTPVIKGASQTGSTLIIDGWTASITNVLLEGDIITAASTNSCNAITGQSTADLRQFVVTANTDSDSSGETATLPIWPSLTTSGAYKTAMNSPANDAVILIHGHASSYAGVEFKSPLYFHPEWATCAVVPLAVPEGTHQASMKTDPDSGLGIRFVMDYDIDDDQYKCRFDILCGLLAQNPDFCCRVYTS